MSRLLTIGLILYCTILTRLMLAVPVLSLLHITGLKGHMRKRQLRNTCYNRHKRQPCLRCVCNTVRLIQLEGQSRWSAREDLIDCGCQISVLPKNDIQRRAEH